MKRKTLLDAADWLLPPNIFRQLTHYRPAELQFYASHRSVLARNEALRDRHLGQRCFVLCNGPSVKRQDITPLRKEIVFSVSMGYHHPAYLTVRPRYHCVPQLTYGHMTEAKAVTWFREMDAGIHDAELFLATQEYSLVQRNGLFPRRTVHYLCFGRNYFPKRLGDGPNLAAILPRAQTVPVMALMIALFMGFKEIHLLGADHDWFVTKRYEYFFDRSKVGWKDEGVTADGSITTSLLDELPNVRRVWEQHHAMKRYAEIAGATIYNATDGGMLDVYPRVRLSDVFCEQVGDAPSTATDVRNLNSPTTPGRR